MLHFAQVATAMPRSYCVTPRAQSAEREILFYRMICLLIYIIPSKRGMKRVRPGQ